MAVDPSNFDEWLSAAKSANPNASESGLAGYWVKKYGFKEPEPEKEGDVSRGFKQSFVQLPQLAGGAIFALGDSLGFDSWKDYGLDLYQRKSAEVEKLSLETDSFTRNWKDGNAGDWADWLQYGFGYTGGQAVQAVATGGLGAIGGKLIGQQALKGFAEKKIGEAMATGLTREVAERQVAGNLAAKIGAGAALGGSNFMQELGQVYPEMTEEVAQQGREVDSSDRLRAFGASALAASVETAADFLNLKGVMQGAKGAGMPGRMAREAGMGLAREAGTEAIQTGIERYGAQKEVFSPEGVREIIDSAALGAIGGAGAGAVAGVRERVDPTQQAMRELDQAQTPEEMREIAMRATTGALPGNVAAPFSAVAAPQELTGLSGAEMDLARFQTPEQADAAAPVMADAQRNQLADSMTQPGLADDEMAPIAVPEVERTPVMTQAGNFATERADPRVAVQRVQTLSNAINAGIATADSKGDKNVLSGTTFSATPVMTSSVKGGSVMEGIARMTNRTVQFMATDNPVRGVNGDSVKGAEGVLFVNVKSNNPLAWVLGHETGHSMERDAPDLWNVMADTMEAEGFLDAERIASTAKKYGSLGKARVEVVNDRMGDAWASKGFWEKLAARHPTLIQPIVKFITDFIASVKATVSSDPVEMKKLDRLQEIVATYSGAYLQRLENNRVEQREAAATEQSYQSADAQLRAAQPELAKQEAADSMKGERKPIGQKEAQTLRKANETYAKAAGLPKGSLPARMDDGSPMMSVQNRESFTKDEQPSTQEPVSTQRGQVDNVARDEAGRFATPDNARAPVKGESDADQQGAVRGSPQEGDAGQAGARGLRDGGGVRGESGVLDGSLRADSRADQPLEGLPARVEVNGRLVTFGPHAPARRAAEAYMEEAGMEYSPPSKYAKVDRERAKRIADEFERMTHAPNDPEVRAAYQAMIDETLAQWRAIKATGLKVEWIEGDDPYGNPRNAILDVTKNNHLYVFPTDDGFGGSESSSVDISGNPLLAFTGEVIDGRVARANDIFRIVHDYFGHIKEGVGFRAEGEENAWQSHAAMYSPLARRAMTTETRGQNSWVNFGPHADFNKTASGAETQYAPQKIGLLSESASSDGRVDFSLDEAPGASRILAAAEQIAAKSRGGPLTESTPENKRTLVRKARKIVAQELATGQGAEHWYRDNMKRALRAVERVFPEVATNPDARDAFIAALAITSNGLTISQNVSAAFDVFEGWKETGTGKLPEMEFGVRGKDIAEGLRKYNQVVEELGPEGAREFLASKMTIKEMLIAADGLIGSAKLPMDFEVYGSAIFGPKIGNGFYSNLSGRLDVLTADRWFFRTWGRLTNTLVRKRVSGQSAGGSILAEDQIAGTERRFAQEVMEEVVAQERAAGHDLTVADAQAILWYAEKRLYDSYGATNENARPTDYATEIEQYLEARRLRSDDAGAQPGGRRADGGQDQARGTEEAGGDASIPLSLEDVARPAESAVRPGNRSGRPGSVEVVGIHYGRMKTPMLSGSMFGTGIRGAEQQRIKDTTDKRLKRRVYFYVGKPGKGLPTPEGGLGPFVYRANLGNLYESGVSPKLSYAGFTQGLDEEEVANNFESAVLDAGYDGYVRRSGGTVDVAVVMNRDVPAELLGNRAQEKIDFSLDEATWSADRIDDLVNEFAYVSGNNKTKAFAVSIDPQDFLEATVPFGYEQSIRDRAGDLDIERLRKQKQSPFLIVSGDIAAGRVSVVGHEGRHRMAALQKAGARRVPVVIVDERGGAERSDVWRLFVGRQRWSETAGRRDFVAKSLIPITYENKERLVEAFGPKESSINFSLDDDEHIDYDDFDLPSEDDRTLSTKIAADVAPLQAERTDDDLRALGREWIDLGRDPARFSYPFSFDSELENVAYDMSERKVRVRGPRPASADEKKYVADGFKPKKAYDIMVGGKPAWVFEDAKGRVALNVGFLQQGASEGALVYQIVGTWAANAGKSFIGDPTGLSNRALFRRTVNMLSNAVRTGSTSHMELHPFQREAGIAWRKGDDEFNAGSMAAWIRDTLSLYAPDQFRDAVGAAAADRGASGRPTSATVDPATAGGGARTKSQVAFTDSALARVVGAAGGGDAGAAVGVRSEERADGADVDGLVDGPVLYSLSGPAVGPLARGGITVNPRAIRDHVADYFTTSKQFNWWDRTIGTQYQKAQKHAGYARVFEAVQDLLDSTSRNASQIADLAPDLLPKMHHWSDAVKGTRGDLPTWVGGTGQNKIDIEAASKALLDGTVEDRVYTNEELGKRGMSARQISMYRQARKAINTSLDQMAVSEMVRITRNMGIDAVRAQAKSMNATDAAAALKQALDGAENVGEVVKFLDAKVGKVRQLVSQGYFPLMRFGPFTIDFKLDGERQFLMFETEAQRNRTLRAIKSEGAIDITIGQKSLESYKLFRGMDPNSLELFGDIAEIDYIDNNGNVAVMKLSDDDLFQKYLKLAAANRSTMKRLIKRKKIAGYNEDGQRVLAAFVTSNARVVARNYHMQEAMTAAAEISDLEGDVKDEAVKLVQYVRDPIEEAGKIRGLLFFNFIGGSMASALVNLTQPITMTMPYLSQWKGAGAALAKGFKLAVSKKEIGGPLGVALKRAIDDGVVEPHEIHMLYAEANRQMGNDIALRRFLHLWGSMFSAAEAFNRRATFIAAYEVGNQMTPAQLEEAGAQSVYDFAIRAVRETQGIYNKGNRPNWARGPIGATLFTFKQYSISYMEWLSRMPRKQQMMALGVLVMLSGLQGLPFADDLDDLIDTLGQKLGYNTQSKLWKRQIVQSVVGKDAGDFVLYGLSAIPGAPLDVQGRMSMGNLIPGTAIFKPSNTAGARDALDILGPIGGLANQIMTGVTEGKPSAFLPVALQNVGKGIDMLQTGMYRDMKGKNVIKTDAMDAVTKIIGFQPNDVADAMRTTAMVNEQVKLAKETEKDIAGKWAEGVALGKPDLVREAMQEVRDWNRRNPEAPIRITPQQVRRRAQQMMMTREERIGKLAPKEMRDTIRRELEAL